MIFYRNLYVSGWNKKDYAIVMFYDEENNKIWKEKLLIKDYIKIPYKQVTFVNDL